MENNTKKMIQRISVFFAVAVSLFIILAVIAIPVNTVKSGNLQKRVQEVLNAAWPDTYIADELLFLNTPLTVSSAAYRVHSPVKPDFKGIAVLVRITGISGPVPAVYLKQDTEVPVFAGIAGVPDSLKKPQWFGLSEAAINYWKVCITQFLEEVTDEQ